MLTCTSRSKTADDLWSWYHQANILSLRKESRLNKFRFWSAAPLLLAATALANCAGMPDYSPIVTERSKGYSETLLKDGTYEVRYRAHYGKTNEEVRDYALLRASELTISNGFNTMEVLTMDIHESTFSELFDSGKSSPSNNFLSPANGGSKLIRRPDTEVTLTIMMSDLPSETSVNHYHAQEVWDRLEHLR